MFVCTSKKLQRKLWENYKSGIAEINYVGHVFRLTHCDDKYYIERFDKTSNKWIRLDSLHPTIFNQHNYGCG